MRFSYELKFPPPDFSETHVKTNNCTLLPSNNHFKPFWTAVGRKLFFKCGTISTVKHSSAHTARFGLVRCVDSSSFIRYRFHCCRSPGTSPRAPITRARRISRGLRNSSYVISHISAGNLAIEVRAGFIDAEWTTKHTCFDGILIERVAHLYEALTGFHWDNPCI